MKGEEKLREVMGNKCIHDEDRVELQDIIGQAPMNKLKEFYAEVGAHDKRMFLWVVFSVMGADTAMDIFHWVVAKGYIQSMVEKAEDRISHRLRGLEDRERIFDKGKRAVHRRLRKMRNEKELADSNAACCGRVLDQVLQRALVKDAEIGRLRSQIGELEDELEEYRIVKQAFAILSR